MSSHGLTLYHRDAGELRGWSRNSPKYAPCTLSSAEVAPALHAGGPWFDPRRVHKNMRRLSNWCARLSVKQVPCGKHVGSNPTRRTTKKCRDSSIGWERWFHTPEVMSSNLILGTTKRSVVRLVRSRSAKSRYIGSIPILTSKIHTSMV
jgi:hypothetical protein